MFECKTEPDSEMKRVDLPSDESFIDVVIESEIDFPEYEDICQNVDPLDVNIEREDAELGKVKKNSVEKQMITRKKSSSFKLRLKKPKGFKCKHCTLVFQSGSALLQHCCTEVRFQCKLCLETFDRESALKIHRACHGTNRQYTCNVCRKSFTRKGTLRDHFLSHKGKRPFQCDDCKEYYRSKVALASHIRHQHFKAKEYMCTICKKMFIMPSALRLHEKSHKKVKEYRCSFCEKLFTYRSSLFRHEREHFDDEEYYCEKCCKAFKKKWSLHNHMRTQHEEGEPIPCEVCGKTFTSKYALKLHMDNHQKLMFLNLKK